jgi:hypothetical protein
MGRPPANQSNILVIPRGHWVFSDMRHTFCSLLSEASGVCRYGNVFVDRFLELNVTQFVKSIYQPEQIELSASIAQSFNQLKLARSQSIQAMPDSSTAAAIDVQIELRNIILFHLREVGSAFVRQLSSSSSRTRLLSTLPHGKNSEGMSARRTRRPYMTRR